MSDYNTPLPLSLEPDSTLPSTEPCNRPLGPPVHQYPKPSDDNFELHVQTLLLQALSAMSPSGPNATLHISSESGQMAPTLAGDRQLVPGNCALWVRATEYSVRTMIKREPNPQEKGT
ncbi:hypothetical protein BGX38DRAFT_574158 [Terfezia claveryi]|nr:hypothetical protein BGX38DRAFT_574158 [Terfezia claveryi]